MAHQRARINTGSTPTPAARCKPLQNPRINGLIQTRVGVRARGRSVGGNDAGGARCNTSWAGLGSLTAHGLTLMKSNSVSPHAQVLVGVSKLWAWGGVTSLSGRSAAFSRPSQ